VSESSRQIVLTLTCPDQVGIVHEVSGLLVQHRCNIEDSQQFADIASGKFFMRVVASLPGECTTEEIRDDVAELSTRFSMQWAVHEVGVRAPILVLVSKYGHCLNDLLYREANGSLPGKIAAVVSNHPDMSHLVEAYDIPFIHLPVSKENRREQEDEIFRLSQQFDVSLVVLARYMQILTPELVSRLQGKAINIHHGLLPAFKGGSPYTQAFDRGVKIIGATAHFVTSDLDEGPIIEQAVAHVDHRPNAAELTRIGQNLECVALTSAVGSFLEHRVMLNGTRTVVFS
jgi:formyltetrahydrofolate deformylase